MHAGADRPRRFGRDHGTDRVTDEGDVAVAREGRDELLHVGDHAIEGRSVRERRRGAETRQVRHHDAMPACDLRLEQRKEWDAGLAHAVQTPYVEGCRQLRRRARDAQQRVAADRQRPGRSHAKRSRARARAFWISISRLRGGALVVSE